MTGTRTEQQVGERLRHLRQQHGLSVRTLAARAQFSPSFISQVESGHASPSIASLERIAGVLGVTLGEFFQAPALKPATVVRAGDHPPLISDWSRARLEALGPVGSGRALEPMMLVLEPGGRTGAHPFAHAGEEFAIVFEGEATLMLGNARHVLRQGDAVTFAAAIPHVWENHGLAVARIVIVSTTAWPLGPALPQA